MQYRKNIFFILVCLTYAAFSSAHHRGKSSDSIAFSARIQSDTIHISFCTTAPDYHLSFLMQGIVLTLTDSLSTKSVVVQFPNARMVRNRVHRHPNEVKATIIDNGKEKRPDLQPLISALNDTTATVTYSSDSVYVARHLICLNRELGQVEYAVDIPN